jgi:intein/homing endonuclease
MSKQDNDWKAFYNEHLTEVSVPKLSLKYGIHPQSLYTAFRRLKLPIKRLENDYGSKYNHSFFSCINSELKAYLLGWIFSDGYITSRNRVGIKLHKKDLAIVELFRDSIAPNLSILSDGDGRCIQFQSRQLYEDLISLGVKRNKTYTSNSIPTMDNHLKRHFIRGYFDGDGSISVTTLKSKALWYICSIDIDILNEIADILTDSGISTKIYKENRDHLGYKSMYKLMPIGKKNNKVSLFNFLYKDVTYKLSRKYKILNNLYGNTEIS